MIEEIREIRETARRGLFQAKRLRKYGPPGPFTQVEKVALTALVEIEKQASEWLALHTTEIATHRDF